MDNFVDGVRMTVVATDDDVDGIVWFSDGAKAYYSEGDRYVLQRADGSWDMEPDIHDSSPYSVLLWGMGDKYLWEEMREMTQEEIADHQKVYYGEES